MKTTTVVITVDDWIEVCEITPKQKKELQNQIKKTVFNLMTDNLQDWSHPRHRKHK